MSSSVGLRRSTGCHGAELDGDLAAGGGAATEDVLDAEIGEGGRLADAVLETGAPGDDEEEDGAAGAGIGGGVDGGDGWWRRTSGSGVMKGENGGRATRFRGPGRGKGREWGSASTEDRGPGTRNSGFGFRARTRTRTRTPTRTRIPSLSGTTERVGPQGLAIPPSSPF